MLNDSVRQLLDDMPLSDGRSSAFHRSGHGVIPTNRSEIEVADTGVQTSLEHSYFIYEGP